MENEDDLFKWALARNTDPPTAHEAAFKLDPETGNWRVALCLYHYPEGLTCDEMDDLYLEWNWINHDGEPHKRVDTLRKKGWVLDTGKIRLSKKTHRAQIVWALTELGRLRMTVLISGHESSA